MSRMTCLSRSTFQPAMVVLLTALAVLVARPATAQVGDADLVRENERLTAEVRDLQAALEAALKRIAELEASLTAARSGSMPSTGPSTTAAVAPPPAASQEGAIAAIRAAFAAAIEAEEIAPLTTAGDQSARVRHLRSLQKWVAAANRTYKSPVTWPVLVTASTVVSSTAGRIRLQVWDPATNAPVGDPFDVPVARRVIERVNRPRSGDADAPAVFALEGVFTPTLRVNEQRTELGAFDNPRFVGPMVELSWAFDVRGVGPWESPEATAVAEDTD